MKPMALSNFGNRQRRLDEIKRLQIGSRPASRAKLGAVNQIRAIPWVFSWMQSRFNSAELVQPRRGSGFYQGDAGLLKEMYDGWAFFRTLLNNSEMSLLKADMDISALYVSLVPDKKLANEIFSSIRAEYERTRETVLAVSRRIHPARNGTCHTTSDSTSQSLCGPVELHPGGNPAPPAGFARSGWG
jgi:phosphoenolpyruvate carboxylase